MRWAAHIVHVEETCEKKLLGKPEGREQLGATKRRLVETIKVDIREVMCVKVYWIHLAQDRDQ
jgi:hypothetical protein